MIRVGQYNTLAVDHAVRGGWVLTDGRDSVLLPARFAPPGGVGIDDDVEVFVYTDSDDQRVATTQRPAGTVGQFVCLEVVDVGPPGAFCDWGLDKDLLIPNNKLHHPLSVGDPVVVAIVLDRHERVMGVSWLHEYFRTDTRRLQVGQAVQLLIYGSTDRGYQAVVDGRYGGMLFHDQTHRALEIGQEIPGFIQGIRDDGRLDLGLEPDRPKRQVMADDAERLAEAIDAAGGFLDLTDKSDPAEINRRLQMSKKAFKRAVGRLYKARRITLEDGGLRKVE